MSIIKEQFFLNMEQNEENNSNCVTGIACVDINDNYMANSLTSNTFTRQQQLINKQANSNRKLFKNTSCSNIDHRKENIKRTTDDNDQFTVQLGQNLDVPINNVADEDDHDDNNNIMEVHDDRQGCRSLVCNFNGIIVAEMIYRCMVCANMADSMAEAHKHYQLKHIDNSCGMSMNTAKSLQRHKEIANISNNTSCSIINSNQPVNLTTNSNRAAKFDSNNINSMTTINSTNGNNSSDLEDYSFSSQEMPLLNFDTPNHFGYEDIDSSFFPSLITPSPASSQTKKARSEGMQDDVYYLPDYVHIIRLPLSSLLNYWSNFNLYIYSFTALVNNTNNSNKSTGNLIVGSGGGGSSSRGGYVTCEVCHITKFYASVQRRYGKFTCMGCAKFFGRFLMKPRRYYCPDLGIHTHLSRSHFLLLLSLLSSATIYRYSRKRVLPISFPFSNRIDSEHTLWPTCFARHCATYSSASFSTIACSSATFNLHANSKVAIIPMIMLC